MNWTKIPTNLLISRTPDNELVAIVKYQLLWADLEYQPTDEIALRYMSNRQLAAAKQYLNDIEAQVVSDIKSIVNHRGGQKTYYKKKQSLKQNNDSHCDSHYDSHCDSQYDVADKIREEKIEEKLLKKKDESASKEGQECPAPSGDPTPPTATQKFSFKDFVAWWNEKFIRCSDNTKDNIVRIRVITQKRESVFKARWADTKRYLTNAKGKPTDAEIFAYMTNEVIGGNYVNSDWMQGKVTNGIYTTPYRVEYDNILAPGFWTKLLEKKYYNRELDKVKFDD